jgi:hypothetical protein
MFQELSRLATRKSFGTGSQFLMQNDQTQYGPIKGNTPSGPFESLTISIVVRMEMQDKTANGTTGDNIQYSCS